jgi:hypothetical protein
MKITGLTCHWLGGIAVALGMWVPTVAAQPCTTDAECAPPTACQPGATTCTQSGQKIDGGFSVSDPVCVSEPAACTWVLTACQSDAECTLPSWACTLLNGADPPTHICFPKGIACPVGATCPAGWSCVDFAAVEEKDLVEMWPATGSTRFCWPDILAGVPDKTMRVDATSIGPIQVKGGGSDDPSVGTADAGSAGGGGRLTVPGSDAGVLVPSSGGGSGCSLVGHGRAAGLWPMLALVLAWRRGRQRAAK